MQDKSHRPDSAIPPAPVGADQRERAARFLAMHHEVRRPLVVGSIWDAASARIFEQRGFAAVATSSAGMAWAHGYPDDDTIPFETLLAAIAAIARAVRIPVSADIGRGFGDTPEQTAQACRAIIAAGGVGVNIEDGSGGAAEPLVNAEAQARRIAAVRAMADDLGTPFVINARTDAWWLAVGDEPWRIQESIRRGRLYRAAGADCIFIPSVIAPDAIGTLAREIDAPINILTVPGCPTIDQLAHLGVARVSQGSGPMRASLALMRKAAGELLDSGSYHTIQNETIPFGEVDALFDPQRPPDAGH